MQNFREFCRIFAMAVRTQLNAAHAQLNKKVRMDFSDHLDLLGKARVPQEEILNNPVALQKCYSNSVIIRTLL